MDDLLADFLTETNESIADLDVALVKLERTPDDQDDAVADLPPGAHDQGHLRLPRPAAAGACGACGRERAGQGARRRADRDARHRDAWSWRRSTGSRLIVAGLAATGTEPAGDDGELIAALNAAAAGEAPQPARACRRGRAARGGARGGTAPEQPARSRRRRARAGAASRPRRTQPPGEPVAANQTIRVTVDVLEDLMTLVSELVLTRNQLLQLARTQENSGFTVPLQRLSHITSDLQEGVMKTRMQPIGNAWNKLPRLVRDLSRDLDKKIELVDARRRDRARPPGAGADQGSADAHGAQQRRPRPGERRPSAAPPASRRPAASR